MEEKIWQLLREINEDIPQNYEIGLIEEGYIDSFAIVNLVASLEEEFNIELEAEDIIPENFYSIQSIAMMVNSRCE